jgi:tetratricopeptide (TPR) repeat protein
MMLADNIIYASCEPVQFLCETGILGGLLLLAMGISFFYATRKEKSLEKELFACVLMASCFYYLFHITLFQCLTLILVARITCQQKTLYKANRLISFLVFVSLLILTVGIMCLATFPKYKNATAITHRIEHKRSLEHYFNAIKNDLNDNKQILAIYALELYANGKIEKFMYITDILNAHTIHSDIEYFKGKSFLRMKDSIVAERHFILASFICPNRFVYRYELFILYKTTGRIDEAKDVALKIQKLKEKVPSATTLAIKMDIEDFLKTDNQKNKCMKKE